MRWLLLSLLACGWSETAPEPADPPAPVPVAEAFDVPPPPGHRTLDVGPVDAERVADLDLGGIVHLDGADGAPLARGEVVDLRRDGGRVTITVYVPEAAAEGALERAVRVRAAAR